MTSFRILGGLCMVTIMAGCAVTESRQSIDAQVSEASLSSAGQLHAFRHALSAEARRAAQEVDRPWIVGKPQPLARDVTLPPALRADVMTTAIFSGTLSGSPQDLHTIAQGLRRATGILIEVTPDALLPAERFLPRLGGAESATRVDDMAPPAMPIADLLVPGLAATRGGAAAWPRASVPVASAAPLTDLVGTSAPLSRLLDAVAMRYGVYWRYDDLRSSIVIYRMQTRVFKVRTMTVDSTLQAKFGLAGNAGDGTTGGFESSSNVEMAPGRRALDAVVGKVSALLTTAGTVTTGMGDSDPAQLGTNTLIVTDVPPVLAQVEKLVEQENKALTRRVRLVFDEVTLAVEADHEAGIDWNLIYQSAAAATGAALTSPSSVLGVAAGSVGASIGSGQWSGSSAVVRALAQTGKVLRTTSVPLLTVNRRPVTHAVRNTFSYIDNVQSTATPSSDGRSSLPSVSINQAKVTTGTILTLLPDAQDDGQILLSLAYDNTIPQPLTAATFGSGASSIMVQQLDIDGAGSVQQVELQPGRPTLVAGFARDENQYTSRRLDRAAPLLLGGSDRAGRSQILTVVIVTAHVEDAL